MEEKAFRSKINCELAVITYDLDCHVITKELDIKPARFFNKGDKITSKHSLSVGSRPYGLWAIQSMPVISDELNVLKQIQYFQEMLDEKLHIIKGLKKQYNLDFVFNIAIETEDAGIGFDLSESELLFINSICNRFSCTFLVREVIKV